ncbi:MAG: hypothetical protein K2Q22_01615, partial [Cytophagales bacterium]|nr:hypothetical protein [Cytophagales bacterium]
QVCFGTPTASGANCYGSPITLTVPVTGSVNASNTYNVQYYTSGGVYQGIISSLNSTTTGLVNFTFSVPGVGNYYFLVTSSNPYATSGSSNILSVSNCIATPSVASSYCPGSSVSLPFSTTQTFNNGNVFIAELVNNSLSTVDFLGSIAGIGGTVPATTITGILPSILTSSSNYQIRIRASLPQALSQLSNSITINQACIGTPTVSGALCLGNVLDIYVPVSGIVNSGNSYNVNVYNSGNAYIGSYSSLSSSATGIIALQLPTTVLGVGSNYKVGIVATNPATVGTPALSSIFSIAQCISTPTTPTSGQCAGSSFPIVFTTTNTFSGSNTFVAELGVNGNYSNPVIIGSVSGSGGTVPATTILGVLPNSVSGSTLYSIRVKATSPNATGYSTGNFNINQLCISQPALASSYSYDSPGFVTVTIGGAADPGNIFSVELSNINSSAFASSPLVLGSISSNSFGVVSIPITIPASGAGNYVVRVKATSPNSTSVTYSSSFAITGKAIAQPSIPTMAVCAGSPLAVNIPVTLATNATFGIGNSFIAELSNGSGSFTSPIVIGSISGISNTTISGFIPAGTPAGTAYRIRIRSTDFPTISDISTGALTINPLCITAGSISGIACFGAPLQIPFTVFGQANTGNVYTARLYDNFGTNYGVIGTLTSTSIGQLQMDAVIPGSLNTSRTYQFGITAS